MNKEGNKTPKPNIKETKVKTTLSFSSCAKYRKLGYPFTKEMIKEKTVVTVKVKDLSRKSNIKITRICLECGKESIMTYHKANVSPICHHCITQSDIFRKKTAKGTQKARIDKGDKENYKTTYELHYGKIPKGWVIHHIDMNRINNDLDNLIALPHGEHLKLHGTLNKLAEELIKRGIIKFNKEKLQYELT